MSISLSEAIGQAQAAFDGGDYRSVVESCSRIVDQFPHYASAQRLLGLAYLEQGQPGEAETWFARLLAHDPREASAYLGLGLIAEDRGVLDNALAYCQVAWELAPEQARFREPITRVAEKRYGSDGKLRLTHAALAQIHAGARRLRRAIKEYQSALIALPDRIDLWMGLAETLWMIGELDDAAEIAREFLKDHPDLARALVLLADVEHQQGNLEEAGRYRDRLRRIDPDGALAAAMVALNPHAHADFLLLPADQQPALEARADTVVSERPQFAPAPDFTFQPDAAAEHASATDLEELQPIRLEEFTDEAHAEPQTASFVPESLEEEEPDTVEVEPIIFDELDVAAAADDIEQPDSFEDLEAVFALDMDDAQPEEPSATGQFDLEADFLNLEAEVRPFDARLEDAPGLALDDAQMDELMGDLDGIEPMSLDEFGANDGELTEMSPGFFEDADIDFDIRIEDPNAVQIGGSLPNVAPGIFPGGGSLSSSSGLGSDDFPELPEVAEPAGSALDDDGGQTILLDDPDHFESAMSAPLETSAADRRQPPAAPPPVPTGTGFTRLLGELGNEGLAPFDPSRTAVHSDASTRGAQNADSGNDHGPSLTEGWDDLDADLASAIPSGVAGTDELLELDGLDLQPFALDDEDLDQVTSVQPAASRPLAPRAADGGPTAGGTEEATEAVDAVVDDLPGLAPFAIEEFDELDAEEPFAFGVLPWERQDDESELDIDIDGLLSAASPVDQESAVPVPPEPAVSGSVFDPDETYVDPSLDITRELGNGAMDPHFAHRMAEVEAAARRNLDRLQREQNGQPVEPISAADIIPDSAGERHPADLLTNPSAELLVSDESLFQRSRSAKEVMVSQGVIQGDREIEMDELAGAPPPMETPESEHPLVAPEPAAPEREPVDLAAPDVAALRATLETDPHDDDARWDLAEALRQRGDFHAAFTEYRWLIRHTPGRHNAVIAALEACAQNDQEADLAHRLLADIYRRRGDSAQARNHASMAMATRRLMREIRM
jgi:tetratricopeptide (TPR) repeat protein